MRNRFKIPGVSFSWKRALGITKMKQQIAKQTGVPLTKGGMERKIGKSIIDLIFKSFLGVSCIATFSSCSPTKQKAEAVSDIDSTLQVAIDTILRSKLEEIDATLGQVIVMEVQTDKVKALVRLDSAFHITEQEIGRSLDYCALRRSMLHCKRVRWCCLIR